MRHAPAYEIRNVTKVFGSPHIVANESINATIEGGEAFGLLGPNGAGKTTLVRQLVGLLVPTSGEIRLFGEPVRANRDRRLGRTVAYLPQGSLTFGEFLVAEAVRWTGVLRGCSTALATSETTTLLEALDLGSVADRQIRKLSGGQRRLVQIAMTLVGRLPVLILDEPTTDVDPALRARIWELISRRASEGSAVILVTHDVQEAEHVLDRVAILDRGSVVATGSPAELKQDLARRTRVEVVVAEQARIDVKRLAAVLPEARVRDRMVSAWVPAEDAVAMLEKVISAAGLDALEDIRLVTPSLEDVYLEIAGHRLDREGER
ncbi:MAG TPA: ABC transporter ATP-binding protein [Actinomycetota bacterium]|nr:ABC transporter ATP-binding protein [Actinomycetota bacterium]